MNAARSPGAALWNSSSSVFDVDVEDALEPLHPTHGSPTRRMRLAGGLVGAAVSGLTATVALTFPALIPVVAPLMLPLAVLGLCAVGGKVVCLGKGWYELYQEVSGRRLTDALPVATLPAPGTPPSE